MAVVIGLPDSYYQWLQTFYASRRSRMLGILDKHGFKYAVPEGAYYVMADFRRLGRGDDDMAFAYWLIDEVGVATVPGSSFYASDPGLGRGLVRFAFPKKDATFDLVEKAIREIADAQLNLSAASAITHTTDSCCLLEVESCAHRKPARRIGRRADQTKAG